MKKKDLQFMKRISKSMKSKLLLSTNKKRRKRRKMRLLCMPHLLSLSSRKKNLCRISKSKRLCKLHLNRKSKRFLKRKKKVLLRNNPNLFMSLPCKNYPKRKNQSMNRLKRKKSKPPRVSNTKALLKKNLKLNQFTNLPLRRLKRRKKKLLSLNMKLLLRKRYRRRRSLLQRKPALRSKRSLNRNLLLKSKK